LDKRELPVFIVTLQGDDARRAALLAALRDQGIRYRLAWGVDGRHGLKPEYESMIDREQAARNYGRPLTDGEFACALSHRAVYQTIFDEGFEAALILEDDAIVSPRLGDFVRSEGPNRYPFLLLDYGKAFVYRFSGLKFGDFGRCLRVSRNTAHATGYILSRQTAEHLLSVTTPVSNVADWPCDLREAGAYALWPRLVEHLPTGNELSHLHRERVLANRLVPGRGKSMKRFLARAYWTKRFLTKILSRRLPG